MNLPNRLAPMPIVDEKTGKVEHTRSIEYETETYEHPPLFAGTINNWQYQPMFKAEEFI